MKSSKYNPQKIEKKWQKEWGKKKIYKAQNTGRKYYVLFEFPYPSGEGLHVGHLRPYIGMDIIARQRRMEGKNVLFPIGWDAFGLPTENFAIKTGIHPAVVTKNNTDTFRRQMKSLGFSFDWSREINTTDPAYYKWTQWIFLQFFKKGLAYKKKMPINWCPSCKIGLANEEVVDGNCERCGTPVEQKEKEQWMLAITKYADRLDKDLDKVDYPERVKIQQRNWIGRSEGALIKFDGIEIFTTRPDTIFGATFIAIPGKEDKFTGRYVINPANKDKIPVWEAEYVMSDYGTGAIMGVPAHDERDFEFAKKHNLPVIDKPLVDAKKITEKIGGKWTTKYKLRDWIFSRQRYWGEPIPLVYCLSKGSPCSNTWIPVPEKDLPVKLPKVESYEPADTGESPLAKIEKWVNVKCPKCDGSGKRETDTMPNWAGSSWYYLRYADPENKKEFADKKKLDYWLPVDWYNGGMEHTTLHLLYSRFWHKFLYDEGLVPTDEPYAKRTSHGMILAEGGAKMSKSKGNIVNPDDLVERFGADSLRLYEMFIGPFEQSASWQEDGIMGPRRFLEKVWKIGQGFAGGERSDFKEPVLEKSLHQTIKKVTEDIESMSFNTAVSALMILANEMETAFKGRTLRDFEMFLKILAPLAPHISEELWYVLGHKNSIHLESWPEYDEEKIKDKEVLIIVQVNGKARAGVKMPVGIGEEEATKKALAEPVVQKWLAGKTPRRIIYIPNRLVNIVI